MQSTGDGSLEGPRQQTPEQCSGSKALPNNQSPFPKGKHIQCAGTDAKLSHHEHQDRRTLTKELGGIGVGGLLIVGEPFIDDLSNSCVEALQLFILGGHTGSTYGAGTQALWLGLVGPPVLMPGTECWLLGYQEGLAQALLSLQEGVGLTSRLVPILHSYVQNTQKT